MQEHLLRDHDEMWITFGLEELQTLFTESHGLSRIASIMGVDTLRDQRSSGKVEVPGFQVKAMDLIEQGDRILEPPLSPSKGSFQVQHMGAQEPVTRTLLQIVSCPLERGVGL